jgi:hypothetical protein
MFELRDGAAGSSRGSVGDIAATSESAGLAVDGLLGGS